MIVFLCVKNVIILVSNTILYISEMLLCDHIFKKKYFRAFSLFDNKMVLFYCQIDKCPSPVVLKQRIYVFILKLVSNIYWRIDKGYMLPKETP